MTRRSALGLLLLAACGGHRAAAAPRRPDLKIEPLTDLVPAAGLVWLVDLQPSVLFGSPATSRGIAEILPDDRLQAFAARHGGVDLRATKELTIARYADATLVLAEAPLDPARVDSALGAYKDRDQFAVLGDRAVALQIGQGSSLLRAAVAFAEARLHRARPALRAEPLSSLTNMQGPASFFAPGPFEGEWASGLGGLLRAATAVAATATPFGEDQLYVRAVVLGAWGDDAPAAAQRLRAAFDLLTEDPLGKLMGLDHPASGPRVGAKADSLLLEVSFDAVTIARGLRAATAGTVADIMRF